MIKVGICGFARAQATIYTTLRLLEVQQTFYRPPKRATADAWRARAPPEFEFTLKAWQLITHEPSSPTYRKAGIELAERDFDRYGSFRPTEQVFAAWAKTNEIRDALGAKMVVFQTPARFNETTEHVNDLRAFFRGVEQQDWSDLTFVWEQRGKWTQRTIASVCAELGLIHGVDPFTEDSVTAGSGFAYFRLHGAPPGKQMYRYTYTDDDLKVLYENCVEMEQVYVLFNNETMYEDALRFMRLIEG
jgi:uncharacterized protein YecE (DUF72 family)